MDLLLQIKNTCNQNLEKQISLLQNKKIDLENAKGRLNSCVSERERAKSAEQSIIEQIRRIDVDIENAKKNVNESTRLISGWKYELNGDQENCIDNTLNICFEGVSSEALMISTKQYCAISNGSACTSKSYDPSYVLKAMGIPTEKIENSVRISWGAGSDKEEIVHGFKEMIRIAKGLDI